MTELCVLRSVAKIKDDNTRDISVFDLFSKISFLCLNTIHTDMSRCMISFYDL